MRTSAMLLLMLAMTLTPACDSGDDGGGGTTSIEVGADDALLNSYTEAEAKAICDSVEQQIVAAISITDNDMDHVGCVMMGLFAKSIAGDDVAVCQAAYEECMNAEPEPDDTEPDEDYDSCAEIYEVTKDCDATTGELEACFEAELVVDKEAFTAMKNLTCSSSMEGMDVTDEETALPECAALYEKCPGLRDF